MRLYPPVTPQKAQSWLGAQVVGVFGAEAATRLATEIAALAEAMSAISAVDLPDDLEPLFP
jgi:hypothetical protein